MQVFRDLISPARAWNIPHILTFRHGARFPGLIDLLRHFLNTLLTAKTRKSDNCALTVPSRPLTANSLPVWFPSFMIPTAFRIDTVSSRTTGRRRARGAGENSNPELACQFGKRYESPNSSGKIAPTLPALLAANDSSSARFEPIRSRLRFHSGSRVHPLHPAINAWRETKP
jgi:hypothetical protein